MLDPLLGQFRLGANVVGEPVESKEVSGDRIGSLPATTRLRDVLAVAGVPAGAYPWGCEGLMLVYDVEGKTRDARLVFDERLVTHEIHDRAQ